MSSALSTARALAAIALAIVAIVLATIANRRWSVRARAAGPEPNVVGPVRTRPVVAQPEVDESTVMRAEFDQLRREFDELAASVSGPRPDSVTLEGELDQLRQNLEALAASASGPRPDPTALRHVALVRYDVFADVGGRLSYSAALLDDTGSGLVLTTLAGKSDVRTYVRTISGGTPDDSLTAEEQRAIDAAVGSGQ